MKKIPTIFARDWNGDKSRVLDEPHPDCGWVFAGEGVPTIKLDGACCMIREGVLYKRREVKAFQCAPPDFEEVAVDETGKRVGWVLVGYGPEDKWFREALHNADGAATGLLADGTYEAIGPHFQGNVERADRDMLVSHARKDLEFGFDVPRTFNGIRSFLEGKDVEGIVFHHPDGRMAKIKGRDFGLTRPKRGRS